MGHTPLVYGRGTDGPPAALELAGHPVPVWWRGPEPDHDEICRLYVEQKLGPPAIAAALGISRMRVDAALDACGITRRDWGKTPCPLTPQELRAAVHSGATVAELSRTYGVSSTAAKRWLADAGLLAADPKLPAELLRQLYVEEGKTTRQIAEQLQVSRARLVHALAAAGIPARQRTDRHRGGHRDAVTDDLVTTLYVDEGLTLDQMAARLSVSTTYLSRRVRKLRLTRRPGWFGPRTGHDPEELRRQAAELYQRGSNVHQVADSLGVSSGTITLILHEAQIPLRGSGFRGREQPPRTLIDDLYADPTIDACLRRHHVRRPDTEAWKPATRWESFAPLPLDPDLLRELYVEIGVSTRHVALLCGVGVSAVRNRMAGAGIALRPASEPCPWTRRRTGP